MWPDITGERFMEVLRQNGWTLTIESLIKSFA